MAFSSTFDPTPNATTVQGASVSNREDLLDVMTILAPEETPILSSAQKSKANSTFVEWTVDSLAAPVTTGISEGADVTSFTDKFASRARLGNFVQKFRRDYLVSDLQEAVDSVGPAKVAQAEAKAIRELKRDIEATLTSNNDRSAENGANASYALRGLTSWIGGTHSDIPSAFQTDGAAVYTNSEANSAALTETVFNGIITEIYKKTGNVNSLTLFADTGLRRHISDFARFGSSEGAESSSLRKIDMGNGEASIKLGVDLYQSDHGIVSIVNANPDCTTAAITGEDENNSGLLLNPEYYGVAELIPMGSTRLPNLGGGERGFVDCALTLLMKHPQGHGRIGDIT
tara:strand:+ start:3370 stop:4401 length:1032 start_codon:yes stop_codon:yes gene_type:complete